MDHTDNQLRACVKALTDVVGPALDPDDAQAAEQAFMVTDYLGYLQSRLDYLHDRHRFEARTHLAMAEAVLADSEALAPDVATDLQAAISAGHAALGDPGVRDPELREVAAQLTAALTRVLRTVATSDDPRRRGIERTVVALTTQKIAVDRAWHLPQGLDGDPSSVVTLDEALGLTAAAVA